MSASVGLDLPIFIGILIASINQTITSIFVAFSSKLFVAVIEFSYVRFHTSWAPTVV